MQDPQNLQVWHRATDTAVAVVRLARYVNADMAPGMRSQLRRAALAIPANIAEGAGADTPAEFARFLDIAIKSTNEVCSHLAIIERLQPSFRGATEVTRELIEVRKMLHALLRYQKAKAAALRSRV
jgi:four helix bundle protein